MDWLISGYMGSLFKTPGHLGGPSRNMTLDGYSKRKSSMEIQNPLSMELEKAGNIHNCHHMLEIFQQATFEDNSVEGEASPPHPSCPPCVFRLAEFLVYGRASYIKVLEPSTYNA